MSTIGFSTGALALGDFKLGLQLLQPTRANAVELSALRSVELPDLLSALPSALPRLKNRYNYISFHAPTDFNDEHKVVEQLLSVAQLGLNIVVHPDTIRDASLWRKLGRNLCLENMDSRKHTGRTVEELLGFFEVLPLAHLCFDLAHARQVDATMTEAARILSQFGNRLAEVHLSEVNSKGRHFAMSFAAKRAYEPFLARMAAIPIILESMVHDDDISHEIYETERLLDREAGIGNRERADLASRPNYLM